MIARMEALNTMPDGLEPVEAAPLLCAGRTTFGAFKNSAARGGDLVESIGGWVGGVPEDALRFSILTGVRPMIEVFPLEQAALAFEKMMSGTVHFRAVLKIGGN